MFYVARRRLRTGFNRVFCHVGAAKLDRTLSSLGIETGVTLCVHSALSSLGYIEGGPRTVIAALMRAVGETGTVMMPTFSTAGTMKSWFDGGERFDVRNTPSKMGAITEIFRTAPGVTRSIHPTHSAAAWGRRADAIVRDHEFSATPFGLKAPYGRLAEMDDSFMLLLGTRLLALPHHLQERVEFPNLFLPEEKETVCLGWKGEEIPVRSRVMRPKVPYFVAIPAADGPDPDWCILHDFCLPFPRSREKDIRAAGFSAPGFDALWRRRAELEAGGIFRTVRLGAAELGLLNIKRFLALVEPELRDLIGRYREHYDCANIASLDLQMV